MTPKAATLGELRAAGYRPSSVRRELRRNLLARLRAGRPLFPGILGYGRRGLWSSPAAAATAATRTGRSPPR